ncbi:MAG: ABC transporter substrate-binding protein [Alistipes indistinctus]
MPDYASGFEMYRYDSSTLLRIVNPWQGADSVSQWVFLSRDDEKPPKGFAGETIDVPVRRIVCMSSSYVAFLEALGADSTICAISGTGYIWSDKVRNRIAGGEIAEAGFDNSLNFEKLVALKPDVVFLYGLTGKNAVTDKLHELGLKTVYIGRLCRKQPARTRRMDHRIRRIYRTTRIGPHAL